MSVTYLSVSVCVCVGARARRRVHVRPRVLPCLSSIQRVCAILCRQLWPLWLHHIFRRYLINGTIFGGGGDD
jgi:hypothetical protein